MDSRSIYWRRQGALRTYCLVSRLLRDLAQPLLFAVVKLTRPRQVSALLSSLRSTGLRTAIKTLYLYQQESDPMFEPDKVERLLAEATLCHSTLRPSCPPRLSPVFERWAVHNCEYYETRHGQIHAYPLEIPYTLLPQLDMVSLSAIDTDTLPVDPGQTSVPILLDVNLNPSRTSAPRFQHSNVRMAVDHAVNGMDDLLDSLVLYLTAKAPLLHLLYLPRLFGGLVTDSPVEARRLQTILETHLPEDTEVVYEDSPYITPRRRSLSSLISPDFWARARAMKAEAE
ncbi:hypothetical protein JCM5296_001197 [Sporobolomyces johnsonii]